MRGLGMASLFVLAAVSAVSGTIAAVAMVDKGASACNALPSSDDESSQTTEFRRASFELRTKALTAR